MVLDCVLLIVGFVALIAGADALIDGAASMARRWGVSNLVIGATIVALGTSLPEMVVNLISAYSGETDLAITNIVGSNIINTFVILGVTACICPILAQKSFRRFDIPLSAVSCLIVLVMLWIFDELNWVCGIVLAGTFAFYMYRMVMMSRSGEREIEDIDALPLWRSLLMIAGGLVGLAVGGQLTVKCAVSIAEACGVSDAVIGLTVVALGTSLPELATSVIAAAKKNTDLAIGNIIGSNIFNVFFVLGLSSILNRLPAYDGVANDVLMAVAGSALVWLFVCTDRKKSMQWWHGAVLLVLYFVYLADMLVKI